MNEEQIKESVINIVSEVLGKPVEEISEDSKFVEDLGADSLDNVELVMKIEEEFDLEIPDEKSMEITSVGQAIAHIREHFDGEKS